MFRAIDNLLTGVASGPVQAAADLLVSLDGAELQLSSVTGQVRIVVDSLFAALRIIRTQTDELRKLDRMLRTGGITAPVYVVETRIALIGAAANPDWLSRRLGAGYTEVDWWGVLRAWPADTRQQLSRLRPGLPSVRGRLPSVRERLPSVRGRLSSLRQRLPSVRRRD